MNRQVKIALLGAALVIVGLVGRTPAARADGICGDLCGCDCMCTDCVCGDCGGCCCCDCGYMFPVYRAKCYNWNGRYAHSAYGHRWRWWFRRQRTCRRTGAGAYGSSRLSHLDHQVQRNYPGSGPVRRRCLAADADVAERYDAIWRVLCARALVIVVGPHNC